MSMISRQKLIEEIVYTTRHDVLYGSYDCYEGNEVLAIIDEIIDLIKSQPPADQWIPCSEGLPELYQPVLVTAIKWQTALLKKPEYYVDTGYCDSEGAFWLSKARTRQYAEAWMPLPEPYKGVE